MLLRILKKILNFGRIPEWRIDVTEHCVVYAGFNVYLGNDNISNFIKDKKAFLIVRVKSGFGYGNMFKAKPINYHIMTRRVDGVTVKLVFYDKKDMLRYKLTT